MEQYLYLVDKSGSGDAHRMLLTTSGGDIVYNKLKTEHWKMTSDVTNFEIVVINNVLYVIGGFDRRTAKPLARLLSFDPLKSQWNERKPMPTPRMKCAAVVKNNRIYVVGGKKAGGIPSSRTEIYDPWSDRWEKGGHLPSPRLRPSITPMAGGSLLCAGGSCNGIVRNNMWILEDNQWRELDDHCPQTLPKCLDKTVLIAVEQTLFLIGGITSKIDHNGKTFLHTNPRMFALKPAVLRLPDQKLADLTCTWELSLPPPQYPRYNAAHLIIGSKMYLLGGANFETGEGVTQVESYDTTTNQWETEFRIVKDNISNVSCAVLCESKEFKTSTIRPESPSPKIPTRYILW